METEGGLSPQLEREILALTGVDCADCAVTLERGVVRLDGVAWVSRNAIRSLMNLSSPEATVRRGGREVRLPVEKLQVGDVIIVRPGERIPMDGTVVVGSSAVNRAPITGESMPVEKAAGDRVFAGMGASPMVTLNGIRLLADSDGRWRIA